MIKKLKNLIVKNMNLFLRNSVMPKDKIFNSLDKLTPLLIIILMIFITLIV